MSDTALDVRGLTTVAHLFPTSRGRRGIYRLRFADGTAYVGQSVDVVRRFGAHRLRHHDIDALEFDRAAARGDLDALEVAAIRDEQARGVTLRNVVHGTTDALAATDLDPLVTPEQQRAFAAGAAVDDVADRVASGPDRVARGRRQFEQLVAGPNGPRAVEIARAYVATTVPRPRATEGSFWVATARPSTGAGAGWQRLVAVSVNAMETLVLGEDPSEPDVISGFLNVRRSTLVEHYGSERAFLHDRRDWIDAEPAPYASAAGDGLRLHFMRTDVAERLFLDEYSTGIRRAAAALNLMLMRKGASLQWRYHNALLGELLTAPPDGP